MATIERVDLKITVDDSDTSEVTVSYTIKFSSLDLLGNLEYKERVRLFGADPGPFDDELTTLRNGRLRPNGQQTVHRTVVKRVANSTLDEDPFGDEIYAKVNIADVDRQFPPQSKNSAEVSGGF